ncbi:SRPBCC family protein [Caldivirga sp.]|jgi:ribosome-associated toxin RatA of RatAB toxin-antitoxin module|uniref:SRPBCC family protein n=1 Tax=Caldivirga sp. TaxID=2080243 RepID=UPI003D0F312F
MIQFKVTRRINVPRDTLWSIISRIEEYPKYWHGHREVKIVGNSGGKLLVNVKFAFKGPLNHGMAYVELGDYMVIFNFLKGPFKGTHIIKVMNGELTSEWNIKLHPLLMPMGRWIIRHFKQGSEHALERVIKDAELIKGTH